MHLATDMSGHIIEAYLNPQKNINTVSQANNHKNLLDRMLLFLCYPELTDLKSH